MDANVTDALGERAIAAMVALTGGYAVFGALHLLDARKPEGQSASSTSTGA